MSDFHKVIPKVRGQVQESKVKSPKGLDSSLWGNTQQWSISMIPEVTFSRLLQTPKLHAGFLTNIISNY